MRRPYQNLYQIKNHYIILNLNVAANLVIEITHEPKIAKL
jgi:hypothetical protein